MSIGKNARNRFDKVKESLSDGCGKVKTTASNTVDSLTLNAPVRKIEEYCRKYTQVLLGMHDDLQEANKRVRKMELRVFWCMMVAVASLLLAIISIAVALLK